MMGARGYHNITGRHSNREPVHEVEITKVFYLGIWPVTQGQFRAWVESESIDHKNPLDGLDNNPVTSVNWHEARRFCQWLMQVDMANSIPEGYQARLPTEAEWEYACSAWQDTPTGRIYTEYHTGDGEVALHEAGWFVGNSGGSTHPAGEKASNQHGLYDMHGNVWVWCLDAYASDEYSRRAGGVCDPFRANDKGALTGPGRLPFDDEALGDAYRVIRGGSWGYSASNCRAAFRGGRRPGHRHWYQGFRVGLFPVHSCQTEQSAK